MRSAIAFNRSSPLRRPIARPAVVTERRTALAFRFLGWIGAAFRLLLVGLHRSRHRQAALLLERYGHLADKPQNEAADHDSRAETPST